MFWIKQPVQIEGVWIYCPKCNSAMTQEEILKRGESELRDSCCSQTGIKLPRKVKVLGIEGHLERKEAPKKEEQPNRSPPLTARIMKIEEEIQQVCQAIADLQLKINSLLLAQQPSGST